MTDPKRPTWTAGIAALLLAAPATAAQRVTPPEGAARPAPWAEVRREPMCIYDGLLAPGGAVELDAARVGTIRSECMRRFGWTEAQGNRGFIVARLMIDMMITRREALAAGVDQSLLDRVFGTFSDDEIASMGSPGQAVSPLARQVAQRLARRLVERGLRGEAASKAGRAIILRMMATHLIAEFAREVGVDPNG